MKSGFIALLHKGQVISSYVYKHASQRKLILAKWQRLYGKKFLDCELAITPDVSDYNYHPSKMIREQGLLKIGKKKLAKRLTAPI